MVFEEPFFTFRFADDRIIPRFHLEGIGAGRRVSVFRIEPGTCERLGLLASATTPLGTTSWPSPVRTLLGPHRLPGRAPVAEAVRAALSGGNAHGHTPSRCR